MKEKLILFKNYKNDSDISEYYITERVNKINENANLFKKLKNTELNDKEYVEIVERLYDYTNLYEGFIVSTPGRKEEKVMIVLFGKNLDSIENPLDIKNIKNLNDVVVTDVMPYSLYKKFDSYHYNLIATALTGKKYNNIKHYSEFKEQICLSEDKLINFKAKVYREILTKEKLSNDYIKLLDLFINILKQSVNDYYKCIDNNNSNIRKLRIKNEMIEDSINNTKDILMKIDEE